MGTKILDGSLNVSKNLSVLGQGVLLIAETVESLNSLDPTEIDSKTIIYCKENGSYYHIGIQSEEAAILEYNELNTSKIATINRSDFTEVEENKFTYEIDQDTFELLNNKEFIILFNTTIVSTSTRAFYTLFHRVQSTTQGGMSLTKGTTVTFKSNLNAKNDNGIKNGLVYSRLDVAKATKETLTKYTITLYTNVIEKLNSIQEFVKEVAGSRVNTQIDNYDSDIVYCSAGSYIEGGDAEPTVILSFPNTIAKAIYLTSMTINYLDENDTAQVYSHTFVSGDFTAVNQTKTLSGIDWTLENGATTDVYFAFSSTYGLQVGSGTKPARELTLTTQGFVGKKVTSIIVQACCAASANVKLYVRGGGVDWLYDEGGSSESTYVQLEYGNQPPLSYTFTHGSGVKPGAGTQVFFEKVFLKKTTDEDQNDYLISYEPSFDVIYINTTTNKIYRYTSDGLIEVSKSLELGNTNDTAYRGDLGNDNRSKILNVLNGTTDFVGDKTFDGTVTINSPLTLNGVTTQESYETLISVDGSEASETFLGYILDYGYDSQFLYIDNVKDIRENVTIGNTDTGALYDLTAKNIQLSGNLCTTGDADSSDTKKPADLTVADELNTYYYNTGITLHDVEGTMDDQKISFPEKSGKFLVGSTVEDYEYIDTGFVEDPEDENIQVRTQRTITNATVDVDPAKFTITGDLETAVTTLNVEEGTQEIVETEGTYTCEYKLPFIPTYEAPVTGTITGQILVNKYTYENVGSAPGAKGHSEVLLSSWYQHGSGKSSSWSKGSVTLKDDIINRHEEVARTIGRVIVTDNNIEIPKEDGVILVGDATYTDESTAYLSKNIKAFGFYGTGIYYDPETGEPTDIARGGLWMDEGSTPAIYNVDRIFELSGWSSHDDYDVLITWPDYTTLAGQESLTIAMPEHSGTLATLDDVQAISGVNNGTLTIKKDTQTLGTFTANSSSDVNINISGGHYVFLHIDSSSISTQQGQGASLTVTLYKSDGTSSYHILHSIYHESIEAYNVTAMTLQYTPDGDFNYDFTDGQDKGYVWYNNAPTAISDNLIISNTQAKSMIVLSDITLKLIFEEY